MHVCTVTSVSQGQSSTTAKIYMFFQLLMESLLWDSKTWEMLFFVLCRNVANAPREERWCLVYTLIFYMLLPETRSTQGLTVSDIFCLLSSWLLSPSIHHTVGIIIISHYLYYSHSPSTCLCWVPQTCLKQISSTIPAVQSTASWGCWWAKSCADEAASLNIPTIPSDVVLVSRHTFVFSSNRILPERKSHCRHTAFIHPFSFILNEQKCRLWINQQESTLSWTQSESGWRHNAPDSVTIWLPCREKCHKFWILLREADCAYIAVK